MFQLRLLEIKKSLSLLSKPISSWNKNWPNLESNFLASPSALWLSSVCWCWQAAFANLLSKNICKQFQSNGFFGVRHKGAHSAGDVYFQKKTVSYWQNNALAWQNQSRGVTMPTTCFHFSTSHGQLKVNTLFIFHSINEVFLLSEIITVVPTLVTVWNPEIATMPMCCDSHYTGKSTSNYPFFCVDNSALKIIL